METKIKSKEFGVTDVISAGWNVYSTNIKTILPIILCIYLPIEIAVSFVPQNTRLHDLILLLLQFFIGIIATLSIAIITEKAIEGESVDWKESIKIALSKWTKAIGTGLLSSVRIFGFTLLFIVPGLIYSLYYVFSEYVVILRDRNGKEALEYSKNLVEGQWWRIFGITFVINLLAIALSLGISYSASLISDNQFFSIFPNTLFDIFTSFFTVMYVLLFLNNDYVYRRQSEVKIPSMDKL